MRNLKILIIDDQDKRYAHIRNIDMAQCITAGCTSTDRLTRWPQHLRWYVDDKVPEFDLLLIDVDFSKDGTTPYYSEGFNPYGLLHALPLAARQHRHRLPFAWAIGTGMRKNMRDNHEAVFAYGLLCAMDRRVDAAVVTARPYQFFQEQIETLGGSTDPHVFVTLMERYREQVIDAAESDRIEFDVEELRAHIRYADRADSSSMKTLLGSGLTMCYGYHTEEISLCSIFAEFDDRDNLPLLVECVRRFLGRLLALAERVGIYDSVMTALRRLREADAQGEVGKVSVNSFINASDRRANLIKMGVLVCCWLEEYVRRGGGKVRAGDITIALGFTQNNQVHEILRRAGIECPLGHYLHLLASRASDLPPSVYVCAERYWNQLKKPRGLTLPGCLRQPDDA